jgi:hypothetical protein
MAREFGVSASVAAGEETLKADTLAAVGWGLILVAVR